MVSLFRTSWGNISNGQKYVGWNWKAGNSSGSANTNGTINSTVSVNTTAGISIVKWTGNATSGATVGHGLGVAPQAIWVKSLSSTQKWCIGHHQTYSSNPWNYFTHFNTTEERGEAAGRWNNTAPTSTVFTIGNDGQVNNNSENYIAYVFAEKGFSKFGSYTGNGNADGTFVYTGFKPALLIGKRVAGGTEDWFMFDNKRDPYNVNHALLYTNTNGMNTQALLQETIFFQMVLK